jgi:hypothetical protein
MNPVLPFRLKIPGKDEFVGLRAESTSFQFHGLARLDGAVLHLEWAGTARVQRVDPLSIRDESLRLPAESLEIPVWSLRRAEVAGRWWRLRLELSARELHALAIVPSEDRGVVRLWFRRRDRAFASALAADLTRAIAAPPQLPAAGGEPTAS